MIACKVDESLNEKVYPLRELYFYLTKGCNLACRHCWIEPEYQRDGTEYPCLPLELFCSIVDQAIPLGLEAIKLTGGEPLLHPQIEDILNLIRKRDIKLIIETNGVLCTPEMAKHISENKKTSISVSLDGADATTHEWVRRVPGCFEKAIGGIKNLVDCGLKPQVIMTLMRKNANQMEAMVRLAEEIGAASVKFNILQPTARGKSMYQMGEALSIEELLSLGDWTDKVLSKSTKLSVFYDHPMSFRLLGDMFGEQGYGCGVCGIKGILGVLADGSYALCGIGETIPEMIFGHASTDRLDYVWKNSKILQEIRKGLPDRLQGICGDCLMKNICLGKCIAQNCYTSKDLWAPNWYCVEAQAAGVFPENRRIGMRKENR